MTYNTGNPIGSSDPRDMFDNAENLDHAVNSTDPSFIDRLGNTRKTLAGLEASGFTAADIYADVATGRAAVADGAQFQVVEGEEIVRYRRDSSSTQTEMARYPRVFSLSKPAETGLYNGWIDPFFRYLPGDGLLLGRQRFFDNGTPASADSVELVENTYFQGRALRKTGTGNLYGVRLWIDDMDVVAGDTISIYALVKEGLAGGTGRIYFRAYDESDSATGAQTPLLDDNDVVIASLGSNPVRLRREYVVPASTAYIWVYPDAVTSGNDMDVVALWAHKGGLSDGVGWPVFGDADYARLLGIEQSSDISDIKSVTVPAVNYAVDSFSQVSADAESIALDGTSFSSFDYDLPFSGWGESYSPAGVSFNALRIKQISRVESATSLWRTLYLIVRKGATPHESGSEVIAVGEASVIQTDDVIIDIDFVLKDPSTGEVKTLSDTDFGSDDYFIGVYARDIDGVLAACGLPRGTMPNTLGQSYYITNTSSDPEKATWAVAGGSSNRRAGFQHILLTNPVELVEYSPSQKLVYDLGEMSGLPVPEIVLPPTIYGVEGRECNIYLDNLHLSDASDYLHDVSADAGIQQNERFTWIPDGAMTSGTLSISVHDKRTGSQLVSASSDQRSATAAAGTGITKKVLVIGDSLVAAGDITQTLLDIAGSDVMSVQLLGTQGGATNKHEGRGGWSVNKYTTEGTVDYRFTVSGVSVSPAIGAAEYSHNGSVYRVEEVDLEAGSGTITCSVVSGGAPQSSGTLTKSNSADGDATITFSASEALSANPFWIGGTLDFGQYLVDNSVDVPDWVFIQLGTNDVFGQSSDAGAETVASSAFSALDMLITSIKAADAGTNVGLMLPPPPSADQDSFGSNYATGQARWRFKRNILIWAREMITTYSGQEGNRIYLVPSNTALDAVNNMRRGSSEPVNSRSSVTVERQNNGVHPATSGYQQIADAVWAFLKFYA